MNHLIHRAMLTKGFRCPGCRREVTLVTVPQAATLAGVSERTIRRWINRRIVHTRRMVSGQIRVCSDSLFEDDSWLDRGPSFSRADERVSRAAGLIEAQYKDASLTLLRVSKELGMSASCLSKLLKGESGVGFGGYLRSVRLRKAEELLHSTALSVKEVAAAVGYKHVSDFNHHFKTAYRATPSEYRASFSSLFARSGRGPEILED